MPPIVSFMEELIPSSFANVELEMLNHYCVLGFRG